MFGDGRPGREEFAKSRSAKRAVVREGQKDGASIQCMPRSPVLQVPEEGTLNEKVSGKRGERTGLSASLFAANRKALPFAQLKVNGMQRRVMVDSGCTRALIHRD